MRRSSSFLAAALLGALLVGTVAVVLSMHVEDLRDSPLAPEPPDWIPAAIPLEAEAPDGTMQRLQLYASNAAAVLARQEIDILFATFGKRVPLARGSLSVAGCVFSVPPGTRVEDNAMVRFVRSPECPAAGVAGPVVMALAMSVPSGDPLVVWTFRPPAPPTSPDLIFVEGRAGTALHVLRGRYVDLRAPSRVRRVHLLNYLWRFTPYPYWIGGVLALAGLLFSTGAFLVAGGSGERRASTTAGVGTACLALSLGILYAVLVPPFEAPDEPDHFLAFADLTGRPDLTRGAAELARIGHLERIKFHRDERFRPVDIDHPYDRAWNEDIFAVPISGRSRTTEVLWRFVDQLTGGLGAPGTLLTIRLANAAMLALAVGIGVALVAAHGAGASAFIVSFAFLLVPTLPLWGVSVSEFASLTSIYVAFASVLAALFLDGAATHRLGLPIGILAALIVAGGRSGAPMLALVAAALAGRALMGTRGSLSRKDAARRAAIFWIGAALGATLLIPAMDEAFSKGLWPGDAGAMPAWFKSAAEMLRNRSTLLRLLLLLPAGILVELALWEVRRVADRWIPRARARAVSGIAYLLAAAVVGVAAVSLAIHMPSLAVFTWSARPALGPYLQATLSSVLTLARLRDHDLLLSTFFWVGFGWLDTLLPIAVVTGLCAVSGALGVWLLLGVGRSGDERRFWWLALLAFGWTATIVLSAIGSYFLYRNLHGRYLLGAYLASLALVWTAPVVRRMSAGPLALVSWRLSAAALFACGALHAYSLCVILQRYF